PALSPWPNRTHSSSDKPSSQGRFDRITGGAGQDFSPRRLVGKRASDPSAINLTQAHGGHCLSSSASPRTRLNYFVLYVYSPSRDSLQLLWMPLQKPPKKRVPLARIRPCKRRVRFPVVNRSWLSGVL